MGEIFSSEGLGMGRFRVEITLNNLGSSFGFRRASKERDALSFGI